MPLSLLLNLRVIGAVVAVLLLAAGGWKCYVMGQQSVQVEFDMYKNQLNLDRLAAEAAARAKEHAMQTANEKVRSNYESLKAATATAVGALDTDRMRLQDALGGAASLSAEAAARADDATRARYVVGQCAKALSRLAGIADATEDNLVGLQDYINNVVKP